MNMCLHSTFIFLFSTLPSGQTFPKLLETRLESLVEIELQPIMFNVPYWSLSANIHGLPLVTFHSLSSYIQTG